MNTYSNAALNDTKDTIADKAGHAYGEVKEKTSEAATELKDATACATDAATKAGRSASKLASTLNTQVSSASDTLVTEIRKRPLQSAAVALFLGVVSSMLYRRKR